MDEKDIEKAFYDFGLIMGFMSRKPLGDETCQENEEYLNRAMAHVLKFMKVGSDAIRKINHIQEYDDAS